MKRRISYVRVCAIFTALLVALSAFFNASALYSAIVNSNETLWVVLSVVGGTLLVLAIVLVSSKKARYKVGRFFSEMFAGIFGKKKYKG